MTLKCLNPKCKNEVGSYDSTCNKCGMDLYYKYHYGIDMFNKKPEKRDE